MRQLVQFYWDCGRMGSVEGLFICDKDELKAAIGKEVYFGEILGKYSEVHGTLQEDHLAVLSEDQEKIEWLAEVAAGTTISGYNPLEYLEGAAST